MNTRLLVPVLLMGVLGIACGPDLPSAGDTADTTARNEQLVEPRAHSLAKAWLVEPDENLAFMTLADADLQLVVTQPANIIRENTNHTYTINLTNLGADSASPNVVVSVNLPTNAGSFQTFTAPGGWSCATQGNVFTWRCTLFVPLATNTVQTFAFTVRSGPQDDQLFLMSASVTSATNDPNPANNSGSLETAVGQNDAPVNTVPGPQTTVEDVELVFSTANGNRIATSDVDVFNRRMRVTLDTTGGSARGAWTLSRTTGLTFTRGDGTLDSSMQFEGTLVNINAALEGLKFTPTLNFYGSTGLVLSVLDLGNSGFPPALADNDIVEINVTPNVNDPPDAVDDAFAVPGEAVDYPLNVMANDTYLPDPPETLTIIGVTQPANGSVTFSATGVLFTPNPGFRGVTTFTYTISDPSNTTDTATVTVTVGQPNNPPTANDDTFTVAEDSATATFNVLANDTPLPDTNEGLTVIAVTQPANGTVTFTANNVRFTPAPNFFGTTTFNYTISDGRQGTDEATVTVNVTAVNDPPTASADTFPVLEDTPTVLDVLANDTYLPDAPETLTITSVTQPANGTVTNNGNNVTFTPPPEYSGTTSFQYIISDGNGGTATATVTVNVQAVNDPPVANPDSFTVVEDSAAATFNVLANDTTGPEAGETISITAVTQPAGGTVTFTPTNVRFTPAPNFFGITTFNYTLEDNNGGTAMGTVTVDVTAVNDPPDAVNDSLSVFANSGPTVLDVLANDTFLPDAPETLTITSVTQPANGAVTNNGNNVTFTPAANFRGTTTFNYTISDGNGGTDTATVTVQVTNNPPTANPDSFTVAEDSGNATFDVLANDGTAPDVGETLTITAVTQPANATATHNGATVTFRPASNFSGTTTFTYTASDGNGGTAVGTVTVNVTAVNDPPTAVNDAFSVPENSGATVLDVLANDSSAPDTGETLTVTGVTQPANGTVTFTPTGVSFTPAANFVGPTSFMYTLSDGNGGTATGTVVVNVTDVNAPPTANNDSFSVPEDSGPTTLDVLANDTTAPDAGETLTITSVTQPANGSVTFTGASVRFTPVANFNGTTTFTYTVSDGTTTATATVTVTVTPVNDPPDAVNDTFEVDEDSGATALDVLANDSTAPDTGETLTVTAVTQPAAGTVTLVGGVVRFTPAAGFSGTTTFNYTVSDGTATDTATVTVTVRPVNDPPTANNDSYTVDEDSGATVLNVLANDSTAPDTGETLTITAVTQPAGGTVTFTGSNVSFTPAANFSGTTTFTYTVSDGNGGTATATVTVTVAPVNDAPDAVNDSVSVAEDSSNNALDVLANDSTVPDVGETLTVTAVTQPATGSVVLAAGVVRYTPPPNFHGTTTFTYTVSDGNGGSDTATVTVTVTPVNDVPDAVDDNFTVAENSAGTALNVLANDLIAPDTGETLTVTAVTQPANGTVTLAGGVVTFTPAPSFTGTTTFTYTVSDGNGGSDTATVTVNVTDMNDPPNAVDDSFTVAEDSSVTVFDVLANDTSAPDVGETLIITGVTQPANGTATFTSAAVRFAPAPNFNGTTNFTYTISDGNGGSDTATITVTVTPVNDLPTAVNDSFTVGEDSGPTTLDVLANDTSSPDVGETLTIVDATQPAGGTVTFTPSNVSFTPVAHFNGPTTFSYRISDGTATATATVTVNVTAVNDPPDAVNDSVTVAEDSGATVVSVLANDTFAPDVGETLTVTAVTQPVGGTVTFTPSNVSFTPNAHFNGTTSFTYTISDGNGGSDTATVSVTVTPVNDPPTANNDSFSVDEDSPGTVLNVLANDTSVPDTGETLTITAVTQPANGSVSFTNANVTFIPNTDFVGTTTFTYTISDGNGGTATATVTVTVGGTNDPPTANNDSYTVAEDSGATPLDVLANDTTAPDVGETLTVTAVTQPANGTVTLAGGVVRFTPAAHFFGTTSFTYTVSDGNGGTSTATVTVSVTSVNDAPDAVDDSFTVAEGSGATAFNVLANDSTGPETTETLTITGVTQPANGTVTFTNVNVSFTPAADFSGTTTFTYTVSDGNGGTDTATVTVTVTPVNDPPDAVNDSYTVDEDSGATPLDVLANDSTAPDVGETLTVSAVTQPVGGTVTLAGGVVSFTPAAHFFGTTTFTYTVSDGNTGSDTATVTVTVTPVNDPPNASDDAFSVQEDNVGAGLNVLANDTTAPDVGETLTITGVTQPANGTVTFTPTDVTFTPEPDFVGNVVFTYTVSDGTAMSTATVTVTVTPVNDPPDAVDDSFTVAEDSGANVLNVLANDTSAPDTGETLTITAVTQPAGGTVTFTGSNVSFTPATNFTGTATFTYTVSDGTATATAAVTVTVTPVNDPPVADDDSFTVAEDSGATAFDVLANDSTGPDTGETLTITAVTQPANGTVVLAGGVVSFTPAPNFHGSTTFTYTVSDGNGGTDTGTVTVTVVPVNDLPTANNDSFLVAVNSGATAFNVLANDTSVPDTGETLTIIAVTQPANGTVTFTGSNVSFTPAPNFTGITTFTYTVSDGNGGTATATVTVNVGTNNNIPPTANDDSYTVAEDSGANVLNVLANDTFAPDVGETLTVTAVTQPVSGTVSFTPANVSFTPAANFSGTVLFTYTVSDGNSGFDTATVTVVVTPENDAPNANDDTFMVAEDSGATVLDVLANDTVVPDVGESLTVRSVTQPANGTVTLVGGVVRYRPPANFSGPTTFTYTVSDGNGGFDTATVTVTVTETNDPPVANNDTLMVAEDSGATVVDVLANDSSAPDTGETLTVTAVTQPANGTATLAGGEVSFTPAPNFFGTTVFTYTIFDGRGATGTAMVTVTVTPVNDAPNANDDSYTVAENSGATVLDVLINDTFAPDVGETLTVAAVTQPANGTVTLSAGVVRFTPNANFSGTTTFTYTVSDGNGGSDTATVTVEVRGSNNPPVANDDSFTVDEDSGATVLTVLTNDTTDAGETLTITGVTQPAGGTVTFTVSDVSFTPNANFSGTTTFTYTVSDGNGLNDSATVTVTVTPVNDAPNANDDSFTVAEDSGGTVLDVLANDTIAPDTGETLTVTAVTQPGSGAVTLVGGVVRFTPAANFSGTVTFEYTLSDGNGGSDTATVTVVVTPVNDAPDAVDDSFTVPEDRASTVLTVLTNDTFAPDVGETLTVTAVTQPANGTVTLVGGLVRFTPAPNFFGTTTFTYTLSDGNGGSDSATVTVEVTPVNDAPNANDDSFMVAVNSSSNVLDVLVNDTIAPDTGETLTITGVTQPANGTVLFTATGVTFTPAAGFSGTTTFTYTISDGSDATDTATVTVEVRGTNNPPKAEDDTFTVDEDSGATVLTVLANDTTAPDAGETLTVVSVTQPANGTVTLVGGVVSFTPAPNFFGTTTFTYTVSDGNNGTDPATVTVTVTPVNDSPDANDDAFTVAENSGARALDVLANDTFAPDMGETLTVTAVTQPANGTVTLVGGVVRFRPNAGFSGTTTFTYTLSDGNGGTDTATVTMTVSGPQGAPVANDDGFTVLRNSTANVLNVLANDMDPDGDALTITAATQPANGTVTFTATSISFTPATGFTGTTMFEYTITDGVDTDTAIVTVTVRAPQQTVPDAVDDSFTVAQDSGATALNVLANDSDRDGDALTITAVTQPANGTVTFTGANVSFTPAARFMGTTTFTYTISDGRGGTDTATVTVTVTAPPPSPPDAVNDSFTVDEDSGATVLTVLANDTDRNDDTLTVTAVTQPATGGSVTLTGGVVRFTPAANFNGTATFEYTISDGVSGTDTATVTVTVNPLNDAPTGMDDTFPVNSNGGPAQLDVLANDTDVDGDTLTVTAVTQPATGGSVAIATNNTGLVFTPTLSFQGAATFTYTVSDGNGGTAVVNVTVNLAPDVADTDGDGLNDTAETAAGTNPNDNDTEDDGIADGTDGLVDSDGDGIINALDSDSDNDGLLDGTEVGATAESAPSGTNRNSPNFRPDADPTTTTNARVADTDGDTLLDGSEDADHDGNLDANETDPNKADTDDDALADNIEVQGENPTNPRDVDTDDDSLDDGEEDADHDGSVDANETDPNNADTDAGGASDGAEVAGGTDPLDDTDDYIIGGTGCASTGASSLMPLALLLGLPLLRRRRMAAGSSQASKAGAWVGLAVLALLVAAPARAQVTPSPVSEKIDVQQYKPGPGSQDVLGLHSPKLGKHMQWNLGASLNYATDPLTVTDPRTDTVVYKLVESQLTVDLMGAIALFDRFELGVALPITSQTSEDSPEVAPVFPEGVSATGLGNLRVVPKVSLLSRDGLHVGAALPIHLPTGGSQFRGGAFTVQPRLLGEWNSGGGVRLLANLGLNLRPKEQVRGLVVGNELAYGLGAEVPFGKLSAGGTLVGAMGLGQDAEERPMELLATVRYRISNSIAAHLGGGPGLSQGYGTPGFRVFAGVAWVAPEGRAAPEPEPKPEPKLAPPPDTDGDGLTDDKDACANEAEDKDGFEDADGCPDMDNDKDGVADAGDACVSEPETQNGYQDADGCPDEVPDTDGDGLKDDKDRCASEAEDMDGFEDADGCPDPDNDRDGVADAADQCPKEPEVINGVKDEDGCPDKGKVKVLVEGEKIVILEKVFFADNKATILPKSFPLLKQVAQVLRANLEIERVRVEGHTDDKGDDAANLALSKARADSVRERLIAEGIAADRLEAVGYGEAKPVDTNKTAKGRENNRRVEFIVTKMKAKEIEVEQP